MRRWAAMAWAAMSATLDLRPGASVSQLAAEHAGEGAAREQCAPVLEGDRDVLGAVVEDAARGGRPR